MAYMSMGGLGAIDPCFVQTKNVVAAAEVWAEARARNSTPTELAILESKYKAAVAIRDACMRTVAIQATQDAQVAAALAQAERARATATVVTPPTFTNPYADRDARILESQRLAAARTAAATATTSTRPPVDTRTGAGSTVATTRSYTKPGTTSTASASLKSRVAAAEKDSPFTIDWDAITGVISTAATTTKTIMDQREASRNPPAVVEEDIGGSLPWGKVAIGAAVGIVGILLVKKALG